MDNVCDIYLENCKKKSDDDCDCNYLYIRCYKYYIRDIILNKDNK